MFKKIFSTSIVQDSTVYVNNLKWIYGSKCDLEYSISRNLFLPFCIFFIAVCANIFVNWAR